MLLTLPAQLDIQQRLRVERLRLQEQLERGSTDALGDFWRATLELYAEHALALFLAPALLAIGYHAGFLRWRGATPGKLACGLRVRRRDADGRLPWRVIAARLGIQFAVPWLALLLGVASALVVGFALAYVVLSVFTLIDPLWAIGPRRQALHDRAARTIVVTTR